MIELVNVSKVYQETHALKNIHFSVQPGEIVGIVGKVALASPRCYVC